VPPIDKDEIGGLAMLEGNEKPEAIAELGGRADPVVMFEMTSDGCAQAKKYLMGIGKLDEFESNKTSVDGYSLVSYANHYKSKET
jgi:hypothetical protein